MTREPHPAEPLRVAVIGAGSWGTTLADLLARKGHRVTLWAREPEVAEGIRTTGRNPFFLPDHDLCRTLHVVTELEAALEEADLGLLAIPSSHLRAVIHPVRQRLSALPLLVNAAKGLETGTGARLSQVILEELGVQEGSSADRLAVLSGPNLAGEIAGGKISACVVASPHPSIGMRLQEVFSTPTFRAYRHTDRCGVELGGTLKNIFAIGAGIVDGLGLGDNAKAAYLTRSLHEMVRLGTRLGGRISTFYGLSGLGDLMATAASPLSRNHQLGQALARGEADAHRLLHGRMVIEGVATTRMALEWGKKLTIPLPITEEISRVLFDRLSPREAARNLMTRSLKDEEE
ncbi:MAG: Glycerol-3-phosphate dehydrogenase [NAD(P)+] [Candidatus Ozemobacter sibiricus]|uniref:Glycerol-3-phosphate dehydrogenase [NAD(P)+] n=1 Tax=Candidatus Ozemobacter sibiricus TaxID=2268124 RepID=A0A367ZUU5_9BACT|nr:MAG: Glycerol-3-phosphate dehydrogenase [NAD(P)+] [Candidatus Ozemobacter sibiricus]